MYCCIVMDSPRNISHHNFLEQQQKLCLVYYGFRFVWLHDSIQLFLKCFYLFNLLLFIYLLFMLMIALRMTRRSPLEGQCLAEVYFWWAFEYVHSKRTIPKYLDHPRASGHWCPGALDVCEDCTQTWRNSLNTWPLLSRLPNPGAFLFPAALNSIFSFHSRDRSLQEMDQSIVSQRIFHYLTPHISELDSTAQQSAKLDRQATET